MFIPSSIPSYPCVSFLAVTRQIRGGGRIVDPETREVLENPELKTDSVDEEVIYVQVSDFTDAKRLNDIAIKKKWKLLEGHNINQLKDPVARKDIGDVIAALQREDVLERVKAAMAPAEAPAPKGKKGAKPEEEKLSDA